MDDISALSFESALEELEKVVRFLEDGKNPLESSIQAYERGVNLRAHCTALLQKSQLRVDMVEKSDADAVILTSFSTAS